MDTKKGKGLKNKAIPRPSVDVLLEAQENWGKLESGKYRVQEEVIKNLFKMHPNNERIEDILLKTVVLNDFYSTNIFSIFGVAKHILSIPNIDELLELGNIELVNKIRENSFTDKKGNEKKKDFYSFATKYCSHHRPDLFPIYDGFVGKVLCYFRNEDKFAYFKNDDLKKYATFRNVIVEFRRFYKLEQFSFKELDRYLWQIGKKYFPSNQ